jgi:hypothetical protein
MMVEILADFLDLCRNDHERCSAWPFLIPDFPIPFPIQEKELFQNG